VTWRVYALSALVTLALAVTVVLLRGQIPLRSQHSRPARVVWPAEVVVDAAGNTFHRPTCPFRLGHAPRQLPMPAAAREGYVPCIYCLPAAYGDAE
jgi:hypothetical protein